MGLGHFAEMLADGVVHVLGVRFHRLTSMQVVEQILMWISEASRRMVITAGPEFVMHTRSDPELQRIVRSADLITPDGIGVLWAAKRQGKVLPERVTGVELVPLLLQTAEQRRQPLRVFVLGATEVALQQCLQYLRAAFPHCEFAGRNGFFSDVEIEDVLKQVRAFEPNLWLVGVGQPRQEKLIYTSLGSLPPCVGIGVGGSIDSWGGAVKRAPSLFRRMNMEWLYRLLRQPNRWRRQLVLPKFAWQVLRNAGRDA